MSRGQDFRHENFMRGNIQVAVCNGVGSHPGANLHVDRMGKLDERNLPEHSDQRKLNSNSGFQSKITRITNGMIEPVFAGRRDVRDPSTVQERQIVSARGTVRGYRNRVRAGIATFLEPIGDKCEEEEGRNFRHVEKGRIIIYTTTMCVVRETWEKCKIVRNILQTHMVRYEEKDLYMSREIQRELCERLEIDQIKVPQVFADGVHIGGAGELEKLNESGELRNILESFPKINVRSSCGKCGGYRFVPCSFCHGSKKSLHRNHFTEEFCALRCMQCDESGLKRCDMCLDQQE